MRDGERPLLFSKDAEQLIQLFPRVAGFGVCNRPIFLGGVAIHVVFCRQLSDQTVRRTLAARIENLLAQSVNGFDFPNRGLHVTRFCGIAHSNSCLCEGLVEEDLGKVCHWFGL